MKTIITLLLGALIPLTFSGCDSSPKKPGGGGHLQPYNPGNGQYR